MSFISFLGAKEIVVAPDSARTIVVNLVAIDQVIQQNRLGAVLTQGKMYALGVDVVPSSTGYDAYGNDLPIKFKLADLKPGQVRLRSGKRPRPVTLRANEGDILEIHFFNLLSSGAATLEILGMQWLDATNNKSVESGASHVFRFYASAEGTFMLMSPDSKSFPHTANDYGLFGAVNVQPKEAEYYRSQVTRKDLEFATLRVNPHFNAYFEEALMGAKKDMILSADTFGLPAGLEIRQILSSQSTKSDKANYAKSASYELRFPANDLHEVTLLAEVNIADDRYLSSPSGQPLINYDAVYPQSHPRAGFPVLNMLKALSNNRFELVHSDLTAIITGPNAGRFPYYLNSPSFRENPATPDRRQPYREFTIMYHISSNTTQAFAPFQDDNDPLYYTLHAGRDAFAINYGIAGIGPEIYANRIGVGPQGINRDGVDLKFEEFFLSSWAVGDPAILVDIPANIVGSDPYRPNRATKALYPDDPSNVYHSYMRDHTKFRVLNTGSVAPHVHHQHAHQWLHTPNSDNSHYLDSQMINPGSTYTMEMTYNGSGNRNQTVGDSIFHCHFYPHFAQGMWSLWRVHDVFEEGTELDTDGRPLPGARALPDGEIICGTPIPALVPLPTIGMAPMPAKTSLSSDGRRVVVEPHSQKADGTPIYKNPGYPFFVPGVAGHRAPHPPLDFAWKEDKQGQAIRINESTADAFNKIGELDYLDGGLPRHVVLDGDIVREFHTRWDFTKDFIAYDDTGNFLKGGLVAVEIPDLGTPLEIAAMDAHSKRIHSSYQPNGLPGNFILNGLPPAPGAPFASPDVDDNGNSNFQALRYKAAVIQTDVVFNKEGWHYPQQRFITLLEDVKPTIEGDRPPEPFFFRANTGETIEFWHTNLVPAYYELDDFQVRTPTDIIGQHIHLVKFDVMASDGAGNGFNYEDGTFSPDEVRDRIHAINAKGGLYHYNEALTASSPQDTLRITPYTEDYGSVLGTPPAGQNWDGAQTTIQRFDTDPLLNNEGEDRTLRTVFTHDHFGPSTHQQVGLYGALLVEPAGSNWIDSLTGENFMDIAKRDGRTDGGPTSWQAIIETHDSKESYREFALAVGDLQLAYKPESINHPEAVKSVWFETVNQNYQDDLNEGRMPDSLHAAFASQGAILSEDAADLKISGEGPWEVINNGLDTFSLELSNNTLKVYANYLRESWSDPQNAIWPPTNEAPKNQSNLALPNPTIISDPEGSGDVGLWVANYRNEPLDQRLQTGVNAGIDSAKATDPSFVFASIERMQAQLNQQPTLGAAIAAGSDFNYPKKEIVPGMNAYDPYTPLLRAYANDRVQIRAIVGAVDSVHGFRLQGQRWLSEPSWTNSGYRNVQGYAISEHFEMDFNLPPVDPLNQASFEDTLYAPSTSTQALVKGTWGLLRTYKDTQAELAELPNNPVGDHNQYKGFYEPPADAVIRNYEVSVQFCEQGRGLQYKVNGAAVKTLVLRANAGDWIRVSLSNEIKTPLPSTLESVKTPSSTNYSSDEVKPYAASLAVGLNPQLLSYNPLNSSGLNLGMNPTQTVAPGEAPISYTWYAGTIDLVDGQRVLTPVEFGGTLLLPSDPLLQASYGLHGVLLIQPEGSTWSDDEAHQLHATIKDANGQPRFTEIVVAGASNSSRPHSLDAIPVNAGSEVRFRLFNSGAETDGNVGNTTNVFTVQGHDWQELPYIADSRKIGNNPLTQQMGTQQVTPLEAYNIVLPSAGGSYKTPGTYEFYYFPTLDKLGSLLVR